LIEEKLMHDLMAEMEIEEATTSHWGFWGTLVWGIVVMGVFAVLQLVAFSAIIGMTHGEVSATQAQALFADLKDSGFVLAVCTIVTTLGCGGLLLVVIKLKRGAILREYLGLTPLPISEWSSWMVAAFVLAGLLDCLTIVLGRPLIPEFMSLAYASADPVWLLWVALVLAAPLFEELFFRGFLLAGFRASFLGPIGAVVLTSASWAAIHLQYDAYDMSTIFVMGCVLGAARLQTGSVLLPIGMHVLHNLIATTEAALL
jgi:hypothetical protein